MVQVLMGLVVANGAIYGTFKGGGGGSGGSTGSGGSGGIGTTSGGTGSAGGIAGGSGSSINNDISGGNVSDINAAAVYAGGGGGGGGLGLLITNASILSNAFNVSGGNGGALRLKGKTL